MNKFNQAISRGSNAVDEVSHSFSEKISREFDDILDRAFPGGEIVAEFGMGAACITVDGDPDWKSLFYDESGEWRTEDCHDDYYEVEDALDEMNQLVHYGDPFYIEYVGKYATA